MLCGQTNHDSRAGFHQTRHYHAVWDALYHVPGSEMTCWGHFQLKSGVHGGLGRPPGFVRTLVDCEATARNESGDYHWTDARAIGACRWDSCKGQTSLLFSSAYIRRVYKISKSHEPGPGKDTHHLFNFRKQLHKTPP